MVKKISEDEFTRKYFRKIRNINENYNQTGEQDSVVIPKDDEKLNEFVNNITKFVGALKIDNNAMIVYPKQGDVILYITLFVLLFFLSLRV